MDDTLTAASRVIQLALTPIFLLGAVGTLLNVFSTRLGRISDRIHALKISGAKHPVELARLKLRSRILDVAVVLAASAGGLTCCSAMLLFLEGLRRAVKAELLFWVFGSALVCAVLSLACYAAEIVIGGRTMREIE